MQEARTSAVTDRANLFAEGRFVEREAHEQRQEMHEQAAVEDATRIAERIQPSIEAVGHAAVLHLAGDHYAGQPGAQDAKLAEQHRALAELFRRWLELEHHEGNDRNDDQRWTDREALSDLGRDPSDGAIRTHAI